MKIAILSYGHFASILPLAKALSHDHEVCLYLMVNGDSFYESICAFELKGLPVGLYNKQSTLDLLDDPIIRYLEGKIQLRLFKYPDLRVKHFKNYILSFRLTKHLMRERYDIVHFNGIKFFPFLIALLLKLRRIVWTIHDPILHTGEEKKEAEILYRLLCRLRINIILHNHSSKDEFINKYGCASGKIHFLPYAPLEVFQVYKNPDIISEPYTVLFFGRISKYKGIEYLIEAAKISQQTIKKLKVIIAGTGSYPIDLQILKNNSLYEIHNRYIPNAELVHLIQRCSVVICPYTDATQSGVIMTAYALSKPVIASGVGGIPEMIKDRETGRLVPPENSVALADAINEMLSESDMQSRYSEAINKHYFKGEFSWSFISNQLTLIYNKVNNKKKNRA
jgi:glycosyltransferase involved in cell wall biosynthesis